MSRLQKVAQEVWGFRSRVSLWWPTPPEDDALRFAFCEAAEALDGILRQNPVYVRNHARVVDLAQEFAQCAIMLVTALGEGHRYGTTECVAVNRESFQERAEEAVRRVALAYSSYLAAPTAATWRVWAEAALIQLFHEPEFAPLETHVGRELARTEAATLRACQDWAVDVCRRAARANGEEGEEVCR